MLAQDMAYYADQDANLNWCALAYAVYAPVEITTDYALATVGVVKKNGASKPRKDAETLQMVEMRKQGMTYWQIADALGKNSDVTVLKRIQRWNERNRNAVDRETAKAVKDQETAEMARMKAEGKTLEEIAEAFGVKLSTVWARIKRMEEDRHD